MGLIIALDGPSGVGKSSTAKLLARRLDLAHLDTGAMYRAVACEFLRQGLEASDTVGIVDLTLRAKLHISTDPDAPRVEINGHDVTSAIREPRVSAVVSIVATVPEVRANLISRMREIIATHHRRIVVEGRDITTVVAPDAEVRVLLTADPEARVARRAAELDGVDHTTVSDSILRRDRDDATVSNFTVAADGVVTIDSTNLSLEEVVDAVLKLVGRRA